MNKINFDIHILGNTTDVSFDCQLFINSLTKKQEFCDLILDKINTQEALESLLVYIKYILEDFDTEATITSISLRMLDSCKEAKAISFCLEILDRNHKYINYIVTMTVE